MEKEVNDAARRNRRLDNMEGMLIGHSEYSFNAKNGQATTAPGQAERSRSDMALRVG
jgi:hypothetical protein